MFCSIHALIEIQTMVISHLGECSECRLSKGHRQSLAFVLLRQLLWIRPSGARSEVRLISVPDLKLIVSSKINCSTLEVLINEEPKQNHHPQSIRR